MTTTFSDTELRVWPSPWGYNAKDGPPKRIEFFGRAPEYTFFLEMEDFLQHNGVFFNPMKNCTCHSDSYMTCVSYANMDFALDLLEETYHPTAAEWMDCLKYWMTNPNCQPPIRIVAAEIMRRNNITPTEVKNYEYPD